MTNSDPADTVSATPAMAANPLPGPSTPRFANIDLLRGLVMVVMLLDHTRDFVHITGLTADPTDLRTTTPALFFTRWIAHYCAPVFVFLAGLSARLQVVRGTSVRDVAGGLVRRGLFFVALELLVLRPLIWFNLDWSFLAHLQVIWAIGWSMCGLGLLLRLPASLLGAFGLLFLAVHNHTSVLPHVPFSAAPLGSLESWRILLFGRGGLQLGGDEGPVAFVQYALVPWFAVMLVGQWCGLLWALPAERRRRWLLGLGIAATGAFLMLRGLRWHGDPSAWSTTETGWRSLASFLRVEKYPPSLHYCLMTLGPALLLLVACERVRVDGPWRHLVTLGRVPLFFYVLQWPAVHLVARLFQWIDGQQPIGWESANPVTLERLPPGCGFSLPVVYAAWALCLVVLVPLSMWFARYRARRPQTRWLRYL